MKYFLSGHLLADRIFEDEKCFGPKIILYSLHSNLDLKKFHSFSKLHVLLLTSFPEEYPSLERRRENSSGYKFFRNCLLHETQYETKVFKFFCCKILLRKLNFFTCNFNVGNTFDNRIASSCNFFFQFAAKFSLIVLKVKWSFDSITMVNAIGQI